MGQESSVPAKVAKTVRLVAEYSRMTLQMQNVMMMKQPRQTSARRKKWRKTVDRVAAASEQR